MRKQLLLPFIFIFLGLTFVSLGFNNKIFADQGENRAGEKIEKKEEGEQAEKQEPTEKPEPTEAKEKENETKEQEQENEAEKVKNEIRSQIENDQVEKIEIQGNGEIKVERKNQAPETKKIKPTKVKVIQTESRGVKTDLNINQNGEVTISGNGITVTTRYPAIIDPATSSISIRTPKGITAISMMPAAAIQAVSPKIRPAIITSASLEMSDNAPVYVFAGTQVRKLFGIIPLKATIQTTIGAQKGRLIRVKQPWYFKLFAPVSTI